MYINIAHICLHHKQYRILSQNNISATRIDVLIQGRGGQRVVFDFLTTWALQKLFKQKLQNYIRQTVPEPCFHIGDRSWL